MPIIDRVTGQPATAYTPPEDCIAVGQPTSGVCRHCGEVIDRHGPVWEARQSGAVACHGLIAPTHEPFGQRMDWQ